MTRPSQFPETFTLDDTDVIPVIKGMPHAPVEHKIKVADARDALGGGGGGLDVPPYIANRQAPVDPVLWADEFDGASLDGAWTVDVPSGTCNVRVGRGQASFRFNAQTSAHMAGIWRALPPGLPAPYAIETTWRVWTMRSPQHLMAGPFVSDGTNITWFMPFMGVSLFSDSLRSGIRTNISTDHGSVERYPYGAMGFDVSMVRLRINGTNLRVERSLDGVQWTLAGSTAWDRTLTFTPTHFGFGVSSWAGSTTAFERLTSVDYMRIYAP